MKKYVLLFLIGLFITFYSEAHVGLLNPSGGETFVSGETLNIQWIELVSHNTLNWDLYFSSDGGSTWQIIQEDISVEIRNYQWIVPIIMTSEAKIRIVQDNTATDYQDASGSFTISTTTGLNTSSLRKKISIYPNPLIDYSTIEIENNNLENYTISIYNMIGQEVEVIDNINTNKIILRRNNLKTGIYLVKISSKNDIKFTSKLIVK